MNTFLEFCSHYFRDNQAFFVAHLAVWGSAIALFAILELRKNKIRAELTGLRTLAEGQYQDYVQPLETFATYFELCSATFVFVGLIGTIYGFAVAIPHLRNPDYNFVELANALATSAFGIFWSVLLNVLVLAHDWIRIQPVKLSLREHVEAEALTRALAEVLAQLQNIPGNMQQVLTTFDKTGESLQVMSDVLVKAATESAAAFTQLNEEAKATIDRTGELVVKLDSAAQRFSSAADGWQGVPQSIASTMQGSAQNTAALLSAALKEVSTHLRDDLRQASTAITTDLRTVNESLAALKTLPEAIARIQQSSYSVDRAQPAGAQPRTVSQTLDTPRHVPRVVADAARTASSQRAQAARAASAGANAGAAPFSGPSQHAGTAPRPPFAVGSSRHERLTFHQRFLTVFQPFWQRIRRSRRAGGRERDG